MLMLRRISLSVLTALVLLAVAEAPAQILNSERIEQTFGSYGIDVLYSDDTLRLSGLYSRHDGRRVIRTFAIVGYPAAVEDEIADLHREILSGGSIGAVFQAAGWMVIKSRHAFFQASLPAVARMMRLPDDSPLAAHAYRLDVDSGLNRLDYAWIIEIHHPEYLSAEDLIAIYGPASPSLPDAARDLLALGQRQITQIMNSTFGE